MTESKLYGRTELRKAELKRRSDAKTLFEAGAKHARAATYLAGYAVECRLKAMAMEIYDVHNLSELAVKWGVADRDVYTHRLEGLLQRLPFWDRFQRGPAWHDFIRHVNRWKPEW